MDSTYLAAVVTTQYNQITSRSAVFRGLRHYRAMATGTDLVMFP